ncbi:MAG: serine/threonine-protein kinase, partial [Planctomycetota bacterium]|nr:serine/threonine-protein kinase [Planctomycetota bacterium]
MRCSECGTETDEQTVFCPKCGTLMVSQTLVNIAQVDSTRVLGGRYIVLSILGRGGMGAVYLAKDTQLDVVVAVKVLPQEIMGDLRAVEWMKEETRLARELRHDNIAAVYNFEIDASKQTAFIVMEFINGVDLHTLLARAAMSRLPPEMVAHILKGSARALDYAHSKRVIHRDVKPKNIMVRKDGTVKVTDFGIAKRLRDTMSKISQTVVAGTPAYMSPEHLEGKAVDWKADIYSLGATVYELLVGEPPYCGSSVELMYQILHTPVRAIAPEVVGGDSGKAERMTAVLRKCLSKNPGERYNSAEEFYNAFCEASGVKGESLHPFAQSEILSPLGMAVTEALALQRQTFSQTPPIVSPTPQTPFETPTIPKARLAVETSPPKKRSRIKVALIALVLLLLASSPILIPMLLPQKTVTETAEEKIPKLAVAEFLVEGDIGRTSAISLANAVAEKIKGDFNIVRPLDLKGILESLGLTVARLNDPE